MTSKKTIDEITKINAWFDLMARQYQDAIYRFNNAFQEAHSLNRKYSSNESFMNAIESFSAYKLPRMETLFINAVERMRSIELELRSIKEQNTSINETLTNLIKEKQNDI